MTRDNETCAIVLIKIYASYKSGICKFPLQLGIASVSDENLTHVVLSVCVSYRKQILRHYMYSI